MINQMFNDNGDDSSAPEPEPEPKPKPSPPKSNTHSNKKANTSPKKDERRQILNTLVKLCRSETGKDGKTPSFDVSLPKQTVSNINTITNNISMPEIQLPPITVVIVKDEKALAKYQEKSNNGTIIVKRRSNAKDPKPAPRTGLENRTEKGLNADIKKCVLMKIKELNIIKA
ncbi:GD10472 [Drosophila simulans]|nr:GD10472 [Drosophila simulans]